MISLLAGVRISASQAIVLFIGRSPSRRPLRFLSVKAASNLDPPDVSRLADAARISLSPSQVEEFSPKIKQVVDWFGQLQDVNLEQIQPSFRADTEVATEPREDCPETFENREQILGAIPQYDNPYIRVPKVVNKE